MARRCPHCGRILEGDATDEPPPWFHTHPEDVPGATDRGCPSTHAWSREYFERRFDTPDPYAFADSPFERRKYERQIACIEQRTPKPGRILEIGCAEGVHTALLARAFSDADIVAIDIATTALERARNRIRADHVEFRHGDVGRLPELVDGSFDLIVCSELIYYLGDRFTTRELFQCLRNVCSCLSDGGLLCMANVVVAESAVPPRLAAGPLIDTYHHLVSRLVAPVERESYVDTKGATDSEYRYEIWLFRHRSGAEHRARDGNGSPTDRDGSS